ncbi:adenylate cyclase [Rhizobium sp. Root73]|uniref:adenylate/guanylate cyclase domain-containing protein n=1 Tax=unclassified Rhizobium TaxID=2613769 RepID=UPI0007152228|nr:MULTISPECIES: adenylate/guanylate cyclase domain-containing protein [unclassified Rhizobium]KQY14322.1 adenylate cyclase [Rhizobium sp. Root1334]KQY26375.1 adenylate cyclase [Rhizobium sp. Root483D2]KRC06208.1 adenylate cyclase [Rhizobium sp. Root73]
MTKAGGKATAYKQVKSKTRVDDNSKRSLDPGSLLSILEWLSGDECHLLDEAGMIAAFGRRLRQIGLPLDRLTLHLMTLHPEIMGRTYAWAPGEPVEVHDREHGMQTAFAATALRRAIDFRETLVVSGTDETLPWLHIDVFEGRGLSQIVIAPLCNADGPVSAVSFASRESDGFTVSEIGMIERLLPALRNTCEIRVMRQAELSLLDTYIGPMTARRILAGRIRQGEVETMEAALLLCDLRGFTELSNRLPEGKVLAILNEYFDLAVPAITRRGGEVLKFMGDAVLAFFPHADVNEASEKALSATMEIMDQLTRVVGDGAGLEAAIALHYGKVSYGNVGSGRRLDFTVIGPDVNMLSRIQAVCGSLGISVLMSSTFKERTSCRIVDSVGFHRMKGFKEPVQLFAVKTTFKHNQKYFGQV